MSGGGFHVHGPHDHELEHAQQGGHGEHGGSMTNQIAMFTAIIATVLQVCIALATIALLTRKKWLEYAMFGAGAVGALAALHI